MGENMGDVKKSGRAFLIDRTNEMIYLNGQDVPFERFFQEAGNPGKDGLNAFELWAQKEENQGKSMEDFFKEIKGKDGKSPLTVLIESTNGQFFKATDEIKSTVLSATVVSGETGFVSKEICDSYTYCWKKNNVEVLVNADCQVIGTYSGQSIPYGVYRTLLLPGRVANKIEVGKEDIDNKAVFTCEVYEK